MATKRNGANVEKNGGSGLIISASGSCFSNLTGSDLKTTILDWQLANAQEVCVCNQ
jgi:hypothetical protein